MPRSDYISRSELIKRIDKWFCKPCEDSGKSHHNVMCGSCDIDAVLSWLDAIPAADVVEVKHGGWVNDGTWPTCNKCGSMAPIDVDEWDFRGKIRPHMADYCPNCGAKMDGGKNDE